jgi:hypothetical protein
MEEIAELFLIDVDFDEIFDDNISFHWQFSIDTGVLEETSQRTCENVSENC